ncbi:outer membrane protein assembly factor BamE [Roseomonas sp. OT10]|uniref:outer membrane protein assembly factor BamE n=1 Tax=Roseomonas cutis TaxID=2897332 RepID=UPI001E5FA4CE|nr:outer membrane protein assembly factor BamE [Roseomonas sp. OT10]UFN50670.1 outer membrane protein assembly factor BamE [Roseomonas sp. OT10]
MARPPHPVNQQTGRPAGHPTRLGKPAGLLLLALAAVPALGGCSLFEAPRELRGNRVDDELLSQITPGVQTKQDVAALLGSPSTTATFDQDHWYYISVVTHIRPARTPGIEDQRVVAITFNPNGVVQEVKRLGDEDRRNIAFVDRQTPVPGNDRTVLQQLFGNIGRFGGGGASSDQGPGGGPGR